MEFKINARLFALVIGIEKHAFKRFNDLPGVTPGVNEIVNWLLADLHSSLIYTRCWFTFVADLQVPLNQVSLITDEAASVQA